MIVSSEKEIFIFEISKNNFESTVIQNSSKIPVLVEFMAIWSGPCIQLSEEISSLAKEFAGQFIFAKVDIDEQADLMKDYGVENIPNLQVFVDGEVVQTQEGLMSHDELRLLLKEFNIYSKIDEMRQQAREKHMAGDPINAIQLLTNAIKQDPSNTKVAMDMAQIFIDLGELDQAEGLFNQLPDSAKDSDMGKMLIGQLTFLRLASETAGKSDLQQQLLTNPDNCDVHFDIAICLIAEKSYQEAINHLFEIMKINKNYKDDAAREMIITVTNMLAPNNPELSSEFRSKLGSFLNV